MKNFICRIMLALFLLPATATMAQKTNSPNDTLAVAVQKLTKTVQNLEKFKITGFIQAQYQKADTLGAKSFNGGDFSSISSQRFMVRRAYLRFDYTGNLASYSVLLNANEKGVSILDAFFTVKDPWLKALTLKGGIFYRPFGYELGYSRTLRESPELGRCTQLMFPNERDMGAMLTFQLPEKSPLHLIKLDAGLFTGNGIASESDDKLDFIGRLGIADNTKNKKISYGLGMSYYNGSVYQVKRKVYYELDDFSGVQAYGLHVADTVNGSYFKREYLGLDAQFSFQTLLGKTTLRGDVMQGTQPAFGKSGSSSPIASVDDSLYIRKFNGATFFLVHLLPGNMHSIVLKYDYYDPNTKIKGDEIGVKATSAKASNGTDIAFTTWGFGWITDFNQNLRLMLYYDLVKNETSNNLKGYHTDQKDNVFTARVQYKF